MKQSELERRTDEIIRKSRLSAVLTTIVAAFVAFSFYYYYSKIQELSGQVRNLNNEIETKNLELERKRAELRNLETEVEDQRLKLAIYGRALNHIQEGTRFFLSRQYEDAIGSYNRYLELVPNSAEALNLLGYSELRYAQYWAENSVRKEISEQQKQEYSQKSKLFFHQSSDHLVAASEISAMYPWPKYNLALVYYFSGNPDKSLETLSSLLSKSPQMIKWLCEDGQFRKMRIDRKTAERFVEIVHTAMVKEERVKCWVIKPPMRG